MSLTGGVAGGTTVLMPSAPMGTLMSEDPVPLVVFWDEGLLGIIMYGACTEYQHWHAEAHAEKMHQLEQEAPAINFMTQWRCPDQQQPTDCTAEKPP